jgi:hypothetical protein
MMPIRELTRMLSVRRSDLAAFSTLDIVDRTKETGATFFRLNETLLDCCLALIREQDARSVT